MILIGVAAGSAWAQAGGKPQYGAWGFDLTAMDRGVRPGADFNRYASGAWLARTQIPADKPIAPIASLRFPADEPSPARRPALIALRPAPARPQPGPRGEEAAAKASSPPRRTPPATTADRAGAFYKAFMDQGRVDALGAAPIGPELAAVREARDRGQLAALMGHTTTDFHGSIFGVSLDVDLKDVTRYAVYVGQAGLGLPDRDYYLEPSFAARKAAYRAYVARMLALAGWPDADANATAVVAFESRIARASWTKAEQRDPEKIYNPMTRAELDALTPGFAWNPFLAGAGLADVGRVVVAEKSAFPRIAAVYQSTPLDTLKAWQAFTIADNAAFYLSQPFSRARFEFRGKTLSGQPEEAARWKRAIRAVAGGDCVGTDRVDCFGNMGFGVGQLYTARYFPPGVKGQDRGPGRQCQGGDARAAGTARLDERGDQGRGAEEARHLSDQGRLSRPSARLFRARHPRRRSGRRRAPRGRVGLAVLCRSPERPRRPERLVDDAADQRRLQRLSARHRLPGRHPAAADVRPGADPAINYGAIGGVIGHELTHGFDDQGRKLDAKGQLRDWWTPADAAAFEARAKGARRAVFEL